MTKSGRRAVFAGLGLLSLMALWQLGFVLGGPLVLPAPADAFAEAFSLIRSGVATEPAAVTTWHVVQGFAIGSSAGLSLGLIGGAVDDLGAALNAISTVILGIPPIIWIVLALFWFGPQGIVPTFTVAIGIAPIIFAAALAGMRGAQRDFDELAAAFNAPWRQQLFEIRLPQLSLALLPALASALGFAWKMALMAEVLDAGSGLGGKIAVARANFDTTQTLAWVVIALALLVITDLLLATLTARWSTARLSADEAQDAGRA
jgi:NitT/TauT family transport system permease protein